MNSKQKRNGHTRYKYKLNMLEPGILMCKVLLSLSVIAVILFLCKLKGLGTIVFLLEVIIIFIMLVLLIIEHHQDEMLYKDAKRDNPEIK